MNRGSFLAAPSPCDRVLVAVLTVLTCLPAGEQHRAGRRIKMAATIVQNIQFNSCQGSAEVNSNLDDLAVYIRPAMRMAFSCGWKRAHFSPERLAIRNGGLEIIRTIRFFLADRHDGQGVLQPRGGVAGARRECDNRQALGRCGRAAGAQDSRRPSQDPARRRASSRPRGELPAPGPESADFRSPPRGTEIGDALTAPVRRV